MACLWCSRRASTRRTRMIVEAAALADHRSQALSLRRRRSRDVADYQAQLPAAGEGLHPWYVFSGGRRVA